MIAHNKDDIIESNDLEEVTSIFGEFKDLEIFEKRLKDANNKLNHH